MIEATLPLPPSANNLFINLKRGGRARSAEYNAWRNVARLALVTAFRIAGSPEVDAKQKMRLTVRVGASYRRDVTNCVKPIEDALCAFLPVPDDRYNDHVVIMRDPGISGFARLKLEVIQ